MSFKLPTLSDLATRVRQAFRANIPGTDAWLFPNNLYVSAKVFAGAVYEVINFADYIRQQIFVSSADSESLDLHGGEYGMARRPAAPAYGIIRITADDEGATVSPGALFRRLDGAEYRATAAVSRLDAGTLDVPVVATTDGVQSNADAGTSMEIVSGAVAGDAAAEVGSDGILGGADIEDDEAFRARILFRKRNPPHGGAASDYVLWAMSLSGVTRVYVERLWAGAGTVRVFPLMDDLYASGIAPTGEINRVADFIETVRPAGAIVTVAAPAAVPVNVTITGLSPDTTAVREAVRAELRDAFRRLSRVAGADTPHGGMPFLAAPAAFSRSWIWQAIANATGEERHIVTTPEADVALTPGQIATLGTVTFSA